MRWNILKQNLMGQGGKQATQECFILSFISSLQNWNTDNRLSYSNCLIRMNVVLWSITWPVKMYFYVNRRGILI